MFKISKKKQLTQKLKSQIRKLKSQIKHCDPCPVPDFEIHVKRLTDSKAQYIDKVIDLEDKVRSLQKPGFIRKMLQKIF